jgi:DHA1 family bicyclomycin/chloramphenicol resistance-like MFS transporter
LNTTARRSALSAWVFALLGALSAFGPLSMDMYLPGLPAMSADLNAPDWSAQATISLCMVGLAFGQLVAGPISDARGRRRPLLVGIAVYTLSSLGCALAPGIVVLLVLRLVQGVAGAAGIAIARAIVRDRNDDPTAAARAFSLLTMVTSVAPVLAPSIGGLVLHVSDWRGVFVVLAAIGLFLLVACWISMPESLPPERRHRGGLAQTGAALRDLGHDPRFVVLTLVGGLSFGAMGAYLAGSSFVLEDLHGLSPQVFAVVFGINGVGLIVASQGGRMLVGRLGSEGLLRAAQAVQLTGAVLVLASAVAGLGIAPLLVGFFLLVSMTGIVVPNVTTLAMIDHPDKAGSASGLLGVAMFAAGAVVAPIAGVAGASALPMAITMVVSSAGAAAALRVLRQPPGLLDIP